MKRAVLVVFLVFAQRVYADAPVLSATAYGRIRFGDTIERAERTLKETVPRAADADQMFCRQVTFHAYPGVTFMVEEGVITRAESSLPIPTSLGPTVGTSLQSVKKSAPSVAIEPHQYDSNGHYLVFKTQDGQAALVMEEGGGKITAVRGGLEPSVEYVEDCL